ncbi:class I SAM-dependent methyltransferase [Oxalobacter aliiformigenes]|uniref:Class I SAM-dependent methyltransferase n=1 Tax=Oxalobacter aliiformigenes TaxID=2946593 RepID=A0ABY7JG69_9BURK|nr:class I SAM-dependent methyltransferase [Oxalobacter aliiformigenes]WAV92916.1 class I SAM-dependent methyltransferase [Oxalobacter aliiformigenes]WAV95581.1 class I SAM-dependent methyltransferase [Oxalobacter aliiformigenes]WAV96625.1 class I SAM-dependent methyltransferase [Oxalobacter aliiformigenes]
MSSKKNTRLTIAAFIFIAFFLPVFVVISAKSQFGLDEMMGPELDAGFITTWPETVDGMLKLAQVNRNDLVYDLGCGDGRIVIAAAKNYGARGVGIDLNPKRIEEANANAKAAEVENLVQFRLGNFYKVDFSDATVVALYLPQTINYELRPILWKQLKIGSRVVSNESDMGSEWPAEKIEKVGTKTVYLWTITEKEKQKAAAIPDPD